MSKLLSTLFVFAVVFAGIVVPFGGSGITPVK
jgi:hypothetical protein